jgi:5'-methylthioadenosine phosphorylase
MTTKYNRTIALIGGTGMAQGLFDVLEDSRSYENVEIEFGKEKGKILFYTEGFYEDTRVIVIPRHGPTLELPDRSPAVLVQEKGYEAHIWLLHTLGVDAVYAFNAVGALDLDIPLASELTFLVPNDYGRGLGATTHSFGNRAKIIHPSMIEPFSPILRQHAIEAIEAVGAKAISEGLYIYSGPDQFETNAEIRATKRLYAEEKNRVVGMTAGVEVVLCKQMAIPYVVICANSNYAQGLVSESVEHELVLDVMKVAASTLTEIARQIVKTAKAKINV